jgi:AcrR family transcriptional regulator
MPHNREPLTRDRIIETALRIVDGQGLGRLTMRRLGDALEVEAMAIYHHMPRGKEELLDGLVAHVAMLPARTTGSAPQDGWRERLRDWATAYRVRLLEHAGVIPLVVTRRNPTALATTTESLREVLRLAGFLNGAAEAGAHTLIGYVIGHAALEVRGHEMRQTTDPDEVVDWDHRFTTGLDVIVSGLLTTLS